MFGIALLIGAAFVAHAVHLAVVADDAYISFRYAKHLADGHGLVWNVGDPPVEGYTNFLWVALCALADWLGADLPTVAPVLGVCAGLGSLLYAWRFARNILELPPLASLLPCALLALSGPFATWASSGMETGLFGFLLLFAAYHYCAWWRFDARRDLALAFGGLLLATLARPEGLLPFALLTGLALLASGRRKAVLAHALIYGIPFGLYFAWRVGYFGFLLPNTFYAKTGASTAQIARGASYTRDFFVFYGWAFLPLALQAAWERVAPVRNIGLAVCGIIALPYTLYIVLVGGDYMAMYRFFVPLLPFLYLPAAALAAATTRKAWTSAALGVAAIGTLLPSTPLDERWFEKPALHHGHHRGVAIERYHVARLALIGRFFDGYKQSPEDTLATRGIGATSWYAHMRIQDLHGLTDPHIAHAARGSHELGGGLAGHEKRDLLYVLEKRPTYFMPTRMFYTVHPPTPRFRNARVNRILEDHYEFQSVRLEDEVNGETGTFAFFELRR